MVRVRHIESQKPEVAGQFPQVNIQDEGRYGDGRPGLSLHNLKKYTPIDTDRGIPYRFGMNGGSQILCQMLTRHPELEPLGNEILRAFEVLSETFASGGKLLVCGNGGSSADADHIVGELMKEFKKKRPLPECVRQSFLEGYGAEGAYLAENLQAGLPALSLSAHTALLTAFANDAKPDLVFAQQVCCLGKPGDTLLALSTSGNSPNVCFAAMTAKSIGLRVIALTGKGGGRLKTFSDVLLSVPEEETDRVQELHLPIYHALCALVEERFFPYDAS